MKHKGHDGKHMAAHKSHDGHSKAGAHMAHAGYTQGEMAPHVADYQAPVKDFAEEGFSKTLQYIERQDHHREMAAHDIKKQHYQGRYS